jgi:hypothetical protein
MCLLCIAYATRMCYLVGITPVELKVKCSMCRKSIWCTPPASCRLTETVFAHAPSLPPLPSLPSFPPHRLQAAYTARNALMACLQAYASEPHTWNISMPDYAKGGILFIDGGVAASRGLSLGRQSMRHTLVGLIAQPPPSKCTER